jgi:hypothetical protein
VTRISARWLAAAVLFAWTLLPAIACAADLRQMTEPEMACCKKMVGKCDMGAGRHSCCDQTVHSQDPAKAILTQTFHLQNAMVFSAVTIDAAGLLSRTRFEEVQCNDGSPPESPPGSINILRI